MLKQTLITSTMKHLLFFALLLTSVATFGQGKTSKMSVKWSETAKLPSGYLMDDLIHADENNVYLLLFGKKGKAMIQHFNGELVLQSQAEIESTSGEVKYVQYTEQALLVYTLDIDKTTNKATVYLEAFGTKGLKSTGKAKKLVSHSSGNIRKAEIELLSYISSDEKRVAVILSGLEDDVKKSTISVFDESFNELWTAKEQHPYSREIENDWISVRVHNSGRLTLLREEHIFKRAAKDAVREGKFPYTFTIHSYGPEGDEESQYVIESEGDRYINGAKLGVLNDGTVVCAGFYGDDPTKEAVKGTYFVRIDANTGLLVGEKYTPFSLEFIKEGVSKGEAKSADKKEKKGDGADIARMFTRRIIPREDGGALLIGEVEYIKIATQTDSKGNQRTTFYLVTKDIILANLSADGELEQATKVNKHQYIPLAFGRLVNGFGYHVIDDKVHFMFNDHIDNLAVRDGAPKEWRSLKKHVAVIVTFDGGQLSNREVFGSLKTDKVFMQPSASRQIDDKRYFIAGQSAKRKARIGIATFK